MKRLFRTIIRIFFLVVLFLFCFAGIDYYRMTKGKLPVFQISTYNSKKREQVFHGTFYTATRVVRANPDEALEESSNVHFYLFQFPIELKVEKAKVKNDFQVEVTPMSTCGGSTLLYADEKVKVYTYCLDKISITNSEGEKDLLSFLQKDTGILEELKGHLAYMGLLSDGTTQQFDSREMDGFEYRIYQCNSLYIPDFYIGPKDMVFQKDFCTFKDDDFKFLYKVSDEAPEDLQPTKNEKGEVVPEVFLEDETYRYEFEVPKSSYVFIVVPENRGRAEKRISLRDVLSQKILTIDELQNKGLVFNKIDKAKEAEEKKKKEEEEKQKLLEEEQKKNNTPQS